MTFCSDGTWRRLFERRRANATAHAADEHLLDYAVRHVATAGDLDSSEVAEAAAVKCEVSVPEAYFNETVTSVIGLGGKNEYLRSGEEGATRD